MISAGRRREAVLGVVLLLVLALVVTAPSPGQQHLRQAAYSYDVSPNTADARVVADPVLDLTGPAPTGRASPRAADHVLSNESSSVGQTIVAAGSPLRSARAPDYDQIASGSCVAAEEAAETAASTEPSVGQSICRVYGGDSMAGGASWSPVDPGSVPDFREVAGLPSGGASGATNTGQFVIEGTLNDPSAVVLQRSALPLDGMKGGVLEYIIPNWIENGLISINRVSGVNPEF